MHNPNSNLMSKGHFVSALGSRTAAVDTSVSAHFKQLDKVFPYSAFILTYREDEDTWEKSCTNHFSDSNRKSLLKTTQQDVCRKKGLILTQNGEMSCPIRRSLKSLIMRSSAAYVDQKLFHKTKISP
mgnify:CR=1 FL=1